jgi:hypothetical protein
MAQHIAHLITLGPRAVGASKVLARHKRPDAVLLVANKATPLQFRVETLVDLGARAIIGRNHQRVLRRFCVLLRDSGDALVAALNLMDSTLAVHKATLVLLCTFRFRLAA